MSNTSSSTSSEDASGAQNSSNKPKNKPTDDTKSRPKDAVIEHLSFDDNTVIEGAAGKRDVYEILPALPLSGVFTSSVTDHQQQQPLHLDAVMGEVACADKSCDQRTPVLVRNVLEWLITVDRAQFDRLMTEFVTELRPTAQHNTATVRRKCNQQELDDLLHCQQYLGTAARKDANELLQAKKPHSLVLYNEKDAGDHQHRLMLAYRPLDTKRPILHYTVYTDTYGEKPKTHDYYMLQLRDGTKTFRCSSLKSLCRYLLDYKVLNKDARESS